MRKINRKQAVMFKYGMFGWRSCFHVSTFCHASGGTDAVGPTWTCLHARGCTHTLTHTHLKAFFPYCGTVSVFLLM